VIEPSPLRRVIALLATAQIPHMLTGSFASTFHGPPRSTQDIDIVIAPSPESLERLLELLPADRQLRDAAGVLRSRFTEVDNAYLDRWAERLDVVALLERPRRLAKS